MIRLKIVSQAKNSRGERDKTIVPIKINGWWQLILIGLWTQSVVRVFFTLRWFFFSVRNTLPYTKYYI